MVRPKPASGLGGSPQAVPVDPLNESVAITAASVFEAQWRRVKGLDPAVRRGGNEVAVHDMRVAVRRARSALRMLSPLQGQSTSDNAASDLKRLSRALGPPRDLDIMLHHCERRVGAFSPELRRAAKPILRRLRADRTVAGAELHEFLRRKAYRRAVDHLKKMASYEGEATPNGSTLREAAPEMVRGRIARAEAALRAIDFGAPNPRDLHTLRIRLKELRYALEFLERGLGPGAGQAVGRLRRVQDVLGAVQDAQVESDRIADWLPNDDPSSARASEALLRATRRDLSRDLRRAQRILPAIEVLLSRVRTASKSKRR